MSGSSSTAAAANVSTLPQPKLPTKEEMQAHVLTHLPYAAWCETCIRGRGREDAHRRKEKNSEESPAMPLISADYCFMNLGTENEKGEPEVATVLVVADSRSGACCASMVPAKGLDALGVRIDCRFLDELG